jgi:glutamate-5-semialdehyde dehydrogenase
VPRLIASLQGAADRRGHGWRLRVTAGSEAYVDPVWFTLKQRVRRADGDRDEPSATLLPAEELGTEWEWEETPEVALVVVESVADAIALYRRHAPPFIASLLSSDPSEHEAFYRQIDAPFVGDGFTRWVDGQYALNRPELGLSNWQGGRLFARGGVLSGDSVYTIRTRMFQAADTIHR